MLLPALKDLKDEACLSSPGLLRWKLALTLSFDRENIKCRKWPLTQWFLRSVKEEANEVRWWSHYFERLTKNVDSSKMQHYCVLHMGLSPSAKQLEHNALRAWPLCRPVSGRRKLFPDGTCSIFQEFASH